MVAALRNLVVRWTFEIEGQRIVIEARSYIEYEAGQRPESLTNAVELVRPLFMDQWPAHPLRHGLVLLVTTVVAFWVALALTRKRFKA